MSNIRAISLAILSVFYALSSAAAQDAALNSYEVFFISLHSLRFAPATADFVRSHPEFTVSCKDGAGLALWEDWKSIPQVTRADINSLEQPDVRVVFKQGGNIAAFTAAGESGYLNGKSVHFSAETQKWFKKHIRPMANQLFVYPPPSPSQKK